MYGAFERASMSPGMARALWDAIVQSDIRDVLPVVNVPTLIIHHTGSTIPVQNARLASERIPNSRYVELDGTDHLPITHDADRIADEIEEFLTGALGARDPNRRLATVLFTDIVGSTGMAASLGDRRWKELLERHDRLVRAELDRFAGREISHTGDGILATFDAPARGIRCARAIRHGLRERGIEIRAGLHTGECEMTEDNLAGMAVHIGARVMAAAGDGEILVSGTVKDLVVGSEIKFTPRGTHRLKGAPGEWALFEVDDDTKPRGNVPAAELAPLAPDLNQRMVTALARRAPRVARAGARILRR
jgi:class 3 adenylate cyclase